MLLSAVFRIEPQYMLESISLATSKQFITQREVVSNLNSSGEMGT